jgi:hypothetical protein
MDPKPNRDPETEEPELVDDSDVVMIDEEASAPDTIPPDGPLVIEGSLRPDDPEVEQALLEEQVDNWFDGVRLPSIPPAPPVPSIPEPSDDDPEDVFYRKYEKP